MKIMSIVAAFSLAAVSASAHAPAFEGTNSNGEPVKLSDFAGKIVVLEWTNPDCPFVKKFYGAGKMQELQKAYTEKGVVWLTIASSAPGKQGHYDAAAWNQMIADKGIASTAVIPDPDGVIGRAYGARTTPHMFVIGADGEIAYQGAMDDKPSTESADIAGAKNYVAAALDELIAGQPVSHAASQPYGCSVKY
jgi:peroxiredoxin